MADAKVLNKIAEKYRGPDSGTSPSQPGQDDVDVGNTQGFTAGMHYPDRENCPTCGQAIDAAESE